MATNQNTGIIFGQVQKPYLQGGSVEIKGFCKKLGSDDDLKVEIFIDETAYTCVKADQDDDTLQRLYKITAHTFRCDLDAQRFKDTHTVSFKEKSSQAHLAGSPIQINTNELRFLNTVASNCRNIDIKKDHIGFFAIEENINDDAFMAYLDMLCSKIDQMHITVFYFDQTLLDRVKKQLAVHENKLTAFMPESMQDFVQNCELFLHNAQAQKNRRHLSKYDTVMQQAVHASNLFTLLFMQPGQTRLIQGSKLDYDHSLASKVFAGDKDEMIYRFFSLGDDVDTATLQSLHKKNAVSFIANEKNITNRNVVNYIKRLKQNHPQLVLTAFYFDQNMPKKIKEIFADYKDSIRIIKPKNIYEVVRESEIYIHNGLQKGLQQHYNLELLKRFIINQTDLFVLDMHNIQSLEPKVRLDVQSRLDFAASAAGAIYKNDAQYRDYKLLNSLFSEKGNGAKEYEQRQSAGFYASADNLHDTTFMSFLQQLQRKLDGTKLTAFYSDPALQSIIPHTFRLCKIDTISQIQDNACVLLLNPQLKNNTFDKFLNQKAALLPDILLQPLNKKLSQKAIGEIYNEKVVNVIRHNADVFGFKSDLSTLPQNHFVFVEKYICEKSNASFDLEKILNTDFYTWAIERILFALKNKTAWEAMIQFQNTIKRLNQQ